MHLGWPRQEIPLNAASCSRAHVSPRLLVALLLALSPFLLRAQTAPPPCTAPDLDVAFRFGNYSPSTYLVAVLSTNVSGRACTLGSQSPPAFYVFDQTPLQVAIAFDSSHPAAITLHPGEIAHQTIRWNTVAALNAPTCQKPSVLNVPANGDAKLPAQLVAPSLLPPICSQVGVESYALGPTFGDDDSTASRAAAAPALRLSSYRVNYLPGESFIIHAESGKPAPGGRAGFRCPPLFLRQRASIGATRLEEFDSPQVRCMTDIHADPGQPYTTAAFDVVHPIHDAGDTTVHLFELTGSPRDPHLAFAESNSITLHIGDDASALATAEPTAPPPTLRAPAQPSPRASAPDTSNLTAYTGWQTAFTLTDTSFGKQSALLDQSTHLEWLRLSATRNKAQETLRRAMLPHKALDGWRFATDDEVQTFFRHFTGTPNGRTTDPAIEIALQRLMGGPLGHSHNTGWSRDFTYGRIQGYYTPTSDFRPASSARFQYHFASIQEETRDGELTTTIEPYKTGWADGDTSSPDTGTFLVREH
jgi:hypothetical protein